MLPKSSDEKVREMFYGWHEYFPTHFPATKNSFFFQQYEVTAYFLVYLWKIVFYYILGFLSFD